jgi:signal transduction histidine kinase
MDRNPPVDTKLLEEVDTLKSRLAQSEESLRRLTRAHTVLSRVNQSLVQATGESKLLDEICGIIVKHGNYPAVRVGFIDEGRLNTFRLAAEAYSAEWDTGMIRDLCASAESTAVPAATATELGIPYIQKYDVSGSLAAPWQAEAIKHGLSACLAFALVADRDAFGALCLYAADTYSPISGEEIELLQQLAAIISFGVNTLRQREGYRRVKAEQESFLKEEQVRQSEKREAVERLAGGVANDFNGLLTAIDRYSDLTLMGLGKDDPLRSNIEEIKKAQARAGRLTRQLQAIGRTQVMQPRPLDLNKLIKDLDRLLGRLLGVGIEIRTVLEPGLSWIWADPGQIEQVIVNLAVNARDAMPRGGTLTIETSAIRLDKEDAARPPTVAPGPFVILAVSHTGAALDRSTQHRIFEPFLITKGATKGTGLGLAAVYGIVKQSGGLSGVYSEPGKGTTFKIYLPDLGEAVEENAGLKSKQGR